MKIFNIIKFRGIGLYNVYRAWKSGKRYFLMYKRQKEVYQLLTGKTFRTKIVLGESTAQVQSSFKGWSVVPMKGFLFLKTRKEYKNL